MSAPRPEPQVIAAQARALLAPFFGLPSLPQVGLAAEDLEARAWLAAFTAAGGWIEDQDGRLCFHCEELPDQAPPDMSLELCHRVSALAREDLGLWPRERGSPGV